MDRFLRQVARGGVMAVTLLCCQGCAKGPATGDIKGMATLDGNSIDGGSIRLIPVDGRTSMGSGNIEQGRFEMRLPVKTYRVEISWPKLPAAGMPDDKFTSGPKNDYVIPERIPKKYNTESELTFEVKPGLNEPRFDLMSH
jgi:hypothetical protein